MIHRNIFHSISRHHTIYIVCMPGTNTNKGDRFRVRQAHPFQEGRHPPEQVLHPLRNPRLPRAGAGALPRARQGRRLLGAGLLPVRAALREDSLYGPAPGGDIQEGHTKRALLSLSSGVSLGYKGVIVGACKCGCGCGCGSWRSQLVCSFCGLPF